MPKIPNMSAEIIFEREAIVFGAYVDGKPVRCLASFEAILKPANNDGFDALVEFTERKAEFHKVARAKIERGGVKNGELWIDLFTGRRA